jgi:hypothetical protein
MGEAAKAHMMRNVVMVSAVRTPNAEWEIGRHGGALSRSA